MESENRGPKQSAGHQSPAHPAVFRATGERHPLCEGARDLPSIELTPKEKAAINQFLAEPGAPCAGTGRALALARGALKFASMLLLAAGVGIGLGDGNEFDDVGCSAAQRPGGASHGAYSARSRDRAGGKLPGAEGGAAGAAGGSGSPGRPECAARAERCANAVGQGTSRVLHQQCRLLGMKEGEGSAPNEELMKVLEEIRRDIAAVARRDWELVKANDELRQLKAGGLFDFAVKIAPADFQIFAAIMALGNRKAAAEFLVVPLRTLYDQVARWPALGKDYQVLVRWTHWRKAVGRKIKLRLEDSVQSGEPNAAAENPQTISEVMESVSAAENRDYPSILLEIMGALKAQNARNWPEVRDQLVEMIAEEVPQ